MKSRIGLILALGWKFNAETHHELKILSYCLVLTYQVAKWKCHDWFVLCSCWHLRRVNLPNTTFFSTVSLSLVLFVLDVNWSNFILSFDYHSLGFHPSFQLLYFHRFAGHVQGALNVDILQELSRFVMFANHSFWFRFHISSFILILRPPTLQPQSMLEYLA